MRKCPADATPIIGGDFNVSIGTADANKDLFNSPVGCQGNPHRNESGNKLRDFMNLHGLCSIATFFEKQCHDTWSFNGDGTRPFQIDHFLARRKELKWFTDCDIMAGAKSNHTPVAPIIRIAKFIPRKSHQAKSQESQIAPRDRKQPRQQQ
jgi:exonuclease III